MMRSRMASARVVSLNTVADALEVPGRPNQLPPPGDWQVWLLLATGLLDVARAAESGALRLSGGRAGEVADWLPLVSLQG